MSKLILSFVCLIVMGLSLYSMDDCNFFYNKELREAIDQQVLQYGECTILHTDCINHRVSVSIVGNKKTLFCIDLMDINRYPGGQEDIQKLFSTYRIYNI